MHAEAPAGCAAGCAHRSSGAEEGDYFRPGRRCRSRVLLVAAVLAVSAQAVCVRAYAPAAMTQWNSWASGGARPGFPSTPPLRARARRRNGPGMVAGSQARRPSRTARRLQLKGADTRGVGTETEEARGERFKGVRSGTTRTELNAFADRQTEPDPRFYPAPKTPERIHAAPGVWGGIVPCVGCRHSERLGVVRSHEERRCSILGPTQSRISPSIL